MTAVQLSDDELLALIEAVKRVARARGVDVVTSDDIAQETIARLLAVGERLEPEARLPYALTTAGNLIISLHRSAATAKKYQPRLVSGSDNSHPETDLLALDEAAAIRAALNDLAPADRQLLLDHVEGGSTITLAADRGTTPGAIAARLARTRARLRLDYVLAFRRTTLPTPNCRGVLLAVSAADQRRQHALNAAAHLAECPTCAELISPLAERRSALAGIAVAPLIALGGLGGRLSRAARNQVVQTAGAATGVVAAGAIVYAAVQPSSHPVVRTPTPPRPATQAASAARIHTASGVPLYPVPSPATLHAYVGRRIIVRGMPVQSVVSHPGFWIGTANNRLYVHLDNANRARQLILAGRYVSFTATLQQNLTSFAVTDGVSANGGAQLLTQQGVHLSVDATAVTESPTRAQ